MQFPFGFGLSYTTFEWEVMSIAVGEEEASLGSAIDLTDADKNTTITLKVVVTNTGSVYGKDVVQLYYTPEYISGEIEKAEVNLLDFDKTISLEPGQSEELTLTFTAYDMASFDATDANNNGASTYELDAGTYTISLRTDSHTLKANDGETMENATIDFTIAEDITFPDDPVTGETVRTPLYGRRRLRGRSHRRQHRGRDAGISLPCGLCRHLPRRARGPAHQRGGSQPDRGELVRSVL